MISEVKTIYEQNARDVVSMMRQLADSIEQGKCPFEIRGAVFVLAGKMRSVDIYSWGDLDNYSTLGVLERAKQHVHKVIDG